MQTLSYPGVYIQEIASGNRTIVGVATSITAFVGRARRGPVNEATEIRSWADFQRTFGPLWVDSPMTYAVYQYFQAGGSQAVIVREVDSSAAAATSTPVATGGDGTILRLDVRDEIASSTRVGVAITHGAAPGFTVTVYTHSGTGWAVAETKPISTIGQIENELDSAYVRVGGSIPAWRPAETGEVRELNADGGETRTRSLGVTALSSGSVTFTAASKGVWGNRVYLTIDHRTGEADSALFNLTATEYDADGEVVTEEVFRNVSILDTHARYVGTILDEQSSLLALGTVVDPTTLTYADGAYRPDTVSDLRLTGGSDGGALTAAKVIGSSGTSAATATGMYAVAQADLFNLLCLPPPSFAVELDATHWAEALEFAADHRAICLVDPPSTWTVNGAQNDFEDLGLTSENGAMYFPRVKLADPLRENRLTAYAPCGVVAGLIAKTDATRGIWKAPAGLDARTPIVRGLEYTLTDAEQGVLNPMGLNCFRTFRGVGTVVWGGRTLAGNNRLSSDWKYLPVRRLALYIEESLYRGMQWAVFEPNDEPLWGQIRMAAGTFMQRLFRQGAFKGASAKDAYFVKCDAETTTDADIDLGIVNLHIGFAPLKPAEFVVISIKQLAGQASV